ncbi:PH domain protein [Rhizophagus clarus]|uniref:PH domain protein n=1 Tax=Rhizophagus clarus TaxID=94130 RepID=A0A8H3M167_9GLOM|nr:PH domain protein [Rhizophagus clarus]
MAEPIGTNVQALPTSTSNLNAVSKRTSEIYSIGLGPRSTTLRPATLKKQRPRRPSFQGDQVTPDMRPVLHLFDIFSRKIYMEGYLCKKDIINNQGRTNSSDEWIEYYVELCGSALSFWKIVNNHDSEIPEVAQAPFMLNLSNCLVDLSIPQDNSVSQRMHVFFLDLIKGEKLYLQAPDNNTLNLWVNAIRLSCFERSRLQEVFTATLIKRSGLKDLGNGTVLMKGKLEDHRAEDKKKKDLSFTRGQALFYESKKSKKPFMTLANVLQTYAIYPEDPALIDKTTTFCVEGTLFPTKPTENKPGDFVILTADSLNEMTKWLFGFFDSFKLYGRPKELLYDFKNPVSPFFAVPTGRSNTKLFLDLHEVEHIEIRESLADVKTAFAETLRQSYNLQQQLPDSQQPPPNINQKSSRKSSAHNLPQIVTDGLSDNYDRQRTFSNESNSSTPSSNSPSTLRPINQTSRPNSMVSLTGGSQRSSISTTPVSPRSPTTNTNRLNSPSSQVTQSNKRRSKRAKQQLASSDESEDQQEDSQSESEKSVADDDDDDGENDDPTLLKNTQENAKVAAEIETELSKIKADESVSFGSSFGTFGDGDFMSEVMTAVAERKDETIQEDTSTKKSKPKRSVSFKNHTAKQKSKNKRRLAPLPSDSEESDNSDDESKSDENNSEEDSSEDSSLNKHVKSGQIINKPGKGNKKKTRVVPQPSDSSDDNEELSDSGKKKKNIQLQQKSHRQSPPYGQYGPGSKQPRVSISSTNQYADKNYPQIQNPLHPQGNFENDTEGITAPRRNPARTRNVIPSGNITDEQFRGRSKGKKPITSEEADSEQEDDNDVKDAIKGNKKDFNSQQDDYQFEIGGLDIDISALNFDTINEPAIETKDSKKGKSIHSDDFDDDDEVLNRTTKVFKPTKQKDKIKNTTKHVKSKSSDSSDDSENNKSSTSDEPLAALVEEGSGLNTNFIRPNFNTPPRSVSPNYPPRSVSPNYPPNQRWGSGSDYVDNMYLSIDNRRSVMMPQIRGGEYYDDDYMKIGGRPRSMMNSGQMMAGRRRVSGGQLDYTRESIYLDDGYYDDRPNHFRPLSLIDSIPQSQLSAREQEMLAKETGTPLINLPERQKDPQTGLVGAITARENQRRAMGPSILARQAELERERAFERERERRLMEQRQQALMIEREREFLHRQSHFGPPMGDQRSSRFLGSQQFLDPGHRSSYYENYGPEDDYDEDDDVPLAASTMPPVQARQSRAARNRRRDTE